MEDETGHCKSLSAEDYFEHSDVQVYLQDAVRQLILRREEQPLVFLRDYFRRLMGRKHVAQREFAFVSRTQYNRKAFICLCDEAFKALVEAEGELNIYDLHQLLLPLCPDFALELLERMVGYLPGIYSSEEGKTSARRLLNAFYIAFYYADFLSQAYRLFAFSSGPSTVSRSVASLLTSMDHPYPACSSFLYGGDGGERGGDEESTTTGEGEYGRGGASSLERGCIDNSVIDIGSVLDSLRTVRGGITSETLESILNDAGCPPSVTFRMFMGCVLQSEALGKQLRSTVEQHAHISNSKNEQAIEELLSNHLDYDEGGKRVLKRKKKTAVVL